MHRQGQLYMCVCVCVRENVVSLIQSEGLANRPGVSSQTRFMWLDFGLEINALLSCRRPICRHTHIHIFTFTHKHTLTISQIMNLTNIFWQEQTVEHMHFFPRYIRNCVTAVIELHFALCVIEFNMSSSLSPFLINSVTHLFWSDY